MKTISYVAKTGARGTYEVRPAEVWGYIRYIRMHGGTVESVK
jgi:hypothetical protein